MDKKSQIMERFSSTLIAVFSVMILFVGYKIINVVREAPAA